MNQMNDPIASFVVRSIEQETVILDKTTDRTRTIREELILGLHEISKMTKRAVDAVEDGQPVPDEAIATHLSVVDKTLKALKESEESSVRAVITKTKVKDSSVSQQIGDIAVETLRKIHLKEVDVGLISKSAVDPTEAFDKFREGLKALGKVEGGDIMDTELRTDSDDLT